MCNANVYIFTLPSFPSQTHVIQFWCTNHSFAPTDVVPVDEAAPKLWTVNDLRRSFYSEHPFWLGMMQISTLFDFNVPSTKTVRELRWELDDENHRYIVMFCRWLRLRFFDTDDGDRLSFSTCLVTYSITSLRSMDLNTLFVYARALCIGGWFQLCMFPHANRVNHSLLLFSCLFKRWFKSTANTKIEGRGDNNVSCLTRNDVG